MCGIAGALSWGNFRITDAYLTAMRDSMTHRGPDGAANWINDTATLGLAHRRLAIIDLSNKALQPMRSIDQRYVIVYNGEIYNHQTLRHELQQNGINQWQTDHSDTEVVLNAFAHWGIDCLHKFRGMFAFALWDTVEQKLWLVRDRIGIKPLYFSIHHQRLTFASEIKALLQDPEQPRAVNRQAFYHYLSFLTTPAPDTLFADIHKLPPGTWLCVDRHGKINEKKYWDVWDHTQPLIDVPEKIIAERVLDELRQAVQLRKISDVPVGVFLSGGIDSSTNAALFSENETRAIHTFSIGYDQDYGTYRNELHYARRMAEHVGADHHELKLNVDDLLNFLPRMVQLQDEPIADPVCIPLYYVAKLARDNGVKVCQVGEGADELFWGYPIWKISLMLQRYNDIPGLTWAKKLLLQGMQLLGKQQSLPYELLRRGVNHVPVFWGGAEAFTENQKQQLLSNNLKKELSGLTSWDAIAPIWQRFQANAWDKSPLHWMTYLDLNYRLPELLLMRVDKMSMGASLESRVPFLDHHFVTLALSIPAKLKTKNGILKNILKQAVRGVIPDTIIDRPKQGFGVPIYEWFSDKLGDTARTVLSDFCRQTDFFDPAAVNALLSQPQRGGQTWYLLNFALWWREFIN